MLSAMAMFMCGMLWRSNDPFNMDISIICQHVRFIALLIFRLCLTVLLFRMPKAHI